MHCIDDGSLVNWWMGAFVKCPPFKMRLNRSGPSLVQSKCHSNTQLFCWAENGFVLQVLYLLNCEHLMDFKLERHLFVIFSALCAFENQGRRWKGWKPLHFIRFESFIHLQTMTFCGWIQKKKKKRNEKIAAPTTNDWFVNATRSLILNSNFVKKMCVCDTQQQCHQHNSA